MTGGKMTGILIDNDLCSRCDICAMVCPVRIIDAADDMNLPRITGEKAPMCIKCGHCEVSCPTEALTAIFLQDEKTRAGASAEISPDILSGYLKSRRSVRHYTTQPVDKDTMYRILDVARYAASGGNAQPVKWIVVSDPEEVHRLAGLTIDWMRTFAGSSHPMSAYMTTLIASWDQGADPICRGAPHLLIAHIPEGRSSAPIDAIIALTHVDITAPAFGVGTCWAGFLSMAAETYEPLKEALNIPGGRTFAYALMFGYPKYRTYRIPRRNPADITWR
jgi:nitroreductase/NAD-dependent dihydropyrimidine dehydrogenase PreA subunit